MTCRECPQSSLCCVCFVKHHLLLSFPKVLSKISVVCPVAFFFPLSPPLLLDSLSPLWGLRLSAVRGVMHTDENSHLLLTLLGRDRGERMTEKEMRSINKNSCPTVFGAFHRPRSASPFYSRGEARRPRRRAVQESLGTDLWEWQGIWTPGLALCLCKL